MSASEQIEAVLNASNFRPPFRRTVIRKYKFMARVYFRDADNKSLFLAMSRAMARELRPIR